MHKIRNMYCKLYILTLQLYNGKYVLRLIAELLLLLFYLHTQNVKGLHKITFHFFTQQNFVLHFQLFPKNTILKQSQGASSSCSEWLNTSEYNFVAWQKLLCSSAALYTSYSPQWQVHCELAQATLFKHCTGTSYSAQWQVRRAKFPVCLPEHRSSQNCKQVQS